MSKHPIADELQRLADVQGGPAACRRLGELAQQVAKLELFHRAVVAEAQEEELLRASSGGLRQ